MIEIKNVTKAYGNETVLEHVNFRFPGKGLVCLLGASGCGKSTLLNLIAGFDSNYTGEITVCGTSISKMNAEELCAYRGRNIGFIFQDYCLLHGYTVMENLLLACEHSRQNSDENKQRARLYLSRIGLEDKENEKIQNLSGGQKQRAAIARALMGSPALLLADEPTGSLDRKTATEIMVLLKELSKERLVVVITHDKKICAFADQTISIENGTITGENSPAGSKSEQNLVLSAPAQAGAFKRGFKNYKVHMRRYIAVALAISIGLLSLLLSLSSGNVMAKSIAEFKEKNTAYNNGYIKLAENENVYHSLKSDERIETMFYQYKIDNVSFVLDGNIQTMPEKFPMPKAAETMSYGQMPRTGKNEIVFSPSLAKKFGPDLSKLVGQEVTLQYQEKEYKLVISGIFNAGYDDFYVSSDVEQRLYEGQVESSAYSVSYDVKSFEDIVPVSTMLKDKGINSISAEKEAGALQRTFDGLNRLFLTVSLLILGIGLFISVILLVKLQNARYREIGLYAALGMQKNTIRSILVTESILLAATAAVFNAVLVGAVNLATLFFKQSISISISQMLLSIAGAGVIVIIISMLASYRLIHTEPAEALKK